MRFSTWTRALSQRGLTVVPPSHPVPVQVWALLADGGAVRFRCRGTTVTLVEFADGDLRVAPSPQSCGCGCGAQAAPPPNPGQFVLRADARPLRTVTYDGRVHGWTSYEAGLLSVPEAAGLFESLYATLQREREQPHRSTPAVTVLPVRNRCASRRAAVE